MPENPTVKTRSIIVTEKKFKALKLLPEGGNGRVTFHFEDNSKNCNEQGGKFCYCAGLTVHAFERIATEKDESKDPMLMEAIIQVEAEFALDGAQKIDDLVWHIDSLCKHKLLWKMRDMLSDTAFSQIPVPSSI